MAAASAGKQLQYDVKSKRAFKRYFLEPKPKVGRPKKRKRKRGGKRKSKVEPDTSKQTMMSGKSNESLTTKQKDELDARLEGSLRKMQRSGPVSRVNWDVGNAALYRKRCADSWMKSTDLFEDGQSFFRFCKRCGIDRNVLKRYLNGKYITNCLTNCRGRPSLLPVSVMRHLCEGLRMLLFW